MKCPQCGKELDIPDNTYMNMQSYNQSCLTITKCCGKLVNTYPIFSYTATKYEGENTTDDWGRETK